MRDNEGMSLVCISPSYCCVVVGCCCRLLLPSKSFVRVPSVIACALNIIRLILRFSSGMLIANRPRPPQTSSGWWARANQSFWLFYVF